MKGWGEPLLNAAGEFSYRGTEVRVQQLERALRDARFRLEVVANLTAAREGTGEPERLTLRAHEVIDRARCWTFEVLLEGLADRVRPEERHLGERGCDRPFDIRRARPDYRTALVEAIELVADEAPMIAGRCLRLTREHPFEVRLASVLTGALPDGLAARTGGVPRLPDFPGLGPFDVSVPDGDDQRFQAVLEFKWWGPPSPRTRTPPKRDETLWDVLKVACTLAAGRASCGYVVVLAPSATWRIEHPFTRLFGGGEWATRTLCGVEPAAMAYFDERHYGVTAVPERIATTPIASRTVCDPCHGEDWILRAMDIERRGPTKPLERLSFDAP